MKHSWIWMAVFSVLFGVVGLLDLLGGETLSGAGLLVCGLGAAFLTLGERREERGRAGRPWKVIGTVVALLGIGLLSLDVFGGA